MTYRIVFGLGFVLLAWSWVSEARAGAIEGNWVNPCADQTKSDLYLSWGAIVKATHQYSDAGCFFKTMDIETHGQYAISSDSNPVPGGTSVDITSGLIYVTIWDARLVDELNLEAYCGIFEWQVGVTQPVNNRSCRGVKMPSQGDKDFDTFKVDALDHLFIGARTHDFDGSTAEKRPRELNTQLEFHRQ